MATHAFATPITALDATGGSRYIRGSFANFGWAFSTTEDRVVTALGLWSYTNPGLSEEHAVGIWDASDNLIATAVVNDTDAAVASAASDGVWRFEAILPVLLPAGDYVIGAYFLTDTEHFRGSTDTAEVDVTLADWLSFGGIRISNGADGDFFQQPTRTMSDEFNPGWFGPNFLSNAVPEPATWGLILIALAAAMRVRRRQDADGRGGRTAR
jgi:hypothetical protein